MEKLLERDSSRRRLTERPPELILKLSVINQKFPITSVKLLNSLTK